jgi:hypothetical protein
MGITAHYEEQLRLYQVDLETGACDFLFDSPISSFDAIGYHHSGNVVFATNSQGLFNLNFNQLVVSYPEFTLPFTVEADLASGEPNEEDIMYLSRRGSLQPGDPVGPTELYRIDRRNHTVEFVGQDSYGDSNLAISDNGVGKPNAAYSADFLTKTLYRVDLTTGQAKPIASLGDVPDLQGAYTSFAPDGTLYYAATDPTQKDAGVWYTIDIETGQATLGGHMFYNGFPNAPWQVPVGFDVLPEPAPIAAVLAGLALLGLRKFGSGRS